MVTNALNTLHPNTNKEFWHLQENFIHFLVLLKKEKSKTKIAGCKLLLLLPLSIVTLNLFALA